MSIRISPAEYDKLMAAKRPIGKPRAKHQSKEGSVVSACIKWLCMHGFEVMRNNTGTAFREYTLKSTGQHKRYPIRFGKKGSGDILACSPTGKWVEIETKSLEGEQKKAQELRQQAITQRGGIYLLVRSVDELEQWKGRLLA